MRSSRAGGLWLGLGAAVARLQAVAWEKGANMGPGLLLHLFQALKKAIAGRLHLRNQADSVSILWSQLFPANHDNTSF